MYAPPFAYVSATWSPMDKDTIASMAGETLIRGTEHKNRQQIQDQIDS